MVKSKRIFAVIAVFVIALTLTACGGNKDDSGVENGSGVEAGAGTGIVGKWEPAEESELGGTLEFKADGELILDIAGVPVTMKYSIEGDELTRSVFGQEAVTTFKLDGDTLEMDGDIYNRAK